MSAKDKLIIKYAADLKDKCGIIPYMDLLTNVTICCNPKIYNPDSSVIAGIQQ